jgi:hypothetical protein
VSAAEALSLDPQQRLLLEAAHVVLSTSGLRRQAGFSGAGANISAAGPTAPAARRDSGPWHISIFQMMTSVWSWFSPQFAPFMHATVLFNCCQSVLTKILAQTSGKHSCTSRSDQDVSGHHLPLAAGGAVQRWP